MKALAISLPDGGPLAPRAWATTSTFERAQGWLRRAAVDPGEGLLIVPCNSIHTFGMRFAVDVAFLDREGRVLKLAHGVPPGRLAWGTWRGVLLPWTLRALELPAGTLAQAGVAAGQVLRIEEREA